MSNVKAAIDNLTSKMSDAMDESGEPVKAQRLLDDANSLMDLYGADGVPTYLLPVLDVKARLLVKLGRLDEALQCLCNIESICRQSGMGIMQSLLEMKARLFKVLGRPEEALSALLEAEKNCKEAKDLAGMAATLECRIDVLSKLGRMDELVLQVGRKLRAEMGEMPSDGGLPPDYWTQ